MTISPELKAKLAAYYMRPEDAEDGKPSFLGGMLGGAALGGLAGGLGGAGYGAYKGHRAWQQADPAYMQSPHRFGAGMTNEQVMGDPNAPAPVRAGVQAGRPSHAGMMGSQALSSSWRPALIGAGTGAALGLLRYLLSR